MNDPLSATAIAVPRELDVGHHPGGRMDGLLGAVVCEQRRSAPLGRPRPKQEYLARVPSNDASICRERQHPC
jgi:hypothetical protein